MLEILFKICGEQLLQAPFHMGAPHSPHTWLIIIGKHSKIRKIDAFVCHSQGIVK